MGSESGRLDRREGVGPKRRGQSAECVSALLCVGVKSSYTMLYDTIYKSTMTRQTPPSCVVASAQSRRRSLKTETTQQSKSKKSQCSTSQQLSALSVKHVRCRQNVQQSSPSMMGKNLVSAFAHVADHHACAHSCSHSKLDDTHTLTVRTPHYRGRRELQGSSAAPVPVGSCERRASSRARSVAVDASAVMHVVRKSLMVDHPLV